MFKCCYFLRYSYVDYEYLMLHLLEMKVRSCSLVTSRQLSSLKGTLPAVSGIKLKGYALLKFSLMTLFAPKWLVHSGGAFWLCQSLLLASGLSTAI